MESEVRELRKANAELRSGTRYPQPRTRTSPRRRSRSQSRSPPRRNQRPHTPPRRRRHHSSSSDSDSCSGRDRNPRRRTHKQYKRTRDRSATPPIDGHTPFSIDAVKCRAFPTTLTGLASQWFTSLPAGSISSYSEIRELFLNEFTTSIDNTKHPINLLVVVQKPNETTRK
ncbi:hypothetical protein PIB30_054642 [Stylosanthes scabra]|uniref:Retrotransposon gag domain-containing protein n=1 Tax=Stylosanthes scabra TaxID=79078 RepID=A0ABU6XJQ7_9FABA|nr:hypothetical protein [Stylosanthes scabra]